MRRRDLVIGLPATLLAASGRAFSQQTRKLPRIGVLVSASPPHPFADAFWRGLRPLGYSEGENMTCLPTGYGGLSLAIRVQKVIKVGSHPFPRCRPPQGRQTATEH